MEQALLDQVRKGQNKGVWKDVERGERPGWDLFRTTLWAYRELEVVLKSSPVLDRTMRAWTVYDRGPV
eukprot:1401110-Rhodomonas_salina.1